MVATCGTSSGAGKGGGGEDGSAWRRPLVAALDLLSRGDFGAAMPLLELAHRLGPDVPEVCLAYGRELSRRGDPGGMPLVERAYVAAPDLLSAGCELARQLRDAGEIDRAAAIAESVCTHHKGDPLAWVCRADVAIEQKRTEEAEAWAVRALELADGSEHAVHAANNLLARCENARGLTRAREGNYESSLFAFKRAADLDPEWSAPITNMGAAFSRLGHHRRALDLYQQARDLEPDSALAGYNIAIELIALADWRGARDMLEEAVRMLLASETRAPDFIAQAHCTLARVYRQLGADARAVRALEFASHVSGAGAGIWAELARAHVRCGELSKARRAARIALELAPSSDEVRAAWTEYAVARARIRDGR